MARDNRLRIMEEFESRRTKVISYVTGDRQGFETKIAFDVIPLLYKHLQRIGKINTIYLFLYSTGGLTMAGWRIVSLIREFCNKFVVLVPYKAHSCATLIALGADQIIMNPMGQLSPVDPTVTTPYNPPAQSQVPGTPVNLLPLSVEDVVSYLDLAKKEAELKGASDLKDVFLKLASTTSPIALGNVHRARSQIRMLTNNLLHYQIKGRNRKGRINKIVTTLTEKLFSHDYLISRKEAKKIGLEIKEPNRNISRCISELYQDFSDEIGLGVVFNPNVFLGNNNEQELQVERAFVESTYGQHIFRTRKVFRRRQIPPQVAAQMPPSGEIIEQRVLQEEWVETVFEPEQDNQTPNQGETVS